MKDKIKISAVSYLNSKPFLYGLYKHDIDKEVALSLDMPSECARKLLSGEVDLGLVPVAVIPQLKESHIISDFCIGAHGKVKTVSIFAKAPLAELTHLYLDYQSRTSVALAKLLLKNYWQQAPTLLEAKPGYIDQIEDKVGALIIGDRTIGLEARFPYVYDLSEAWTAWTGLPFVFAAWVANKALPTSFISTFNAALMDGINCIDQVAQLFQSSHLHFDVLEYYQKYISYPLDDAKKAAMQLFLSRL
jgi:chorismate dehydratase